jgi:hypothetical protein
MDKIIDYLETAATDPRSPIYASDLVPPILDLCEIAKRLQEVAKGYEAWEADIVLDGDWTMATPFLTSGQFDRMLELQRMRNAALALTGG